MISKRGYHNAILFVATRPLVGKTSVCMSIMNALRKRLGKNRVGFIKPIGLRSIEVDGFEVDPDANLARVFYGLKDSVRDISPVIISKGYVKSFLEKKVDREEEICKIERSFKEIVSKNDFTVVEGTGHVGTGSIVGMNNAMIAKRLGIPVVLVCSGGLGSSYDELALNKQVCDNIGVPVCGVIVNKVRVAKMTMIEKYMRLAMKQLEVPLLGCIPHNPSYDSPSCANLEILFGEKLLSKRDAENRRFSNYELVTTSLPRFMERINSKRSGRIGNTCFVTHISRVDLIMGLHTHMMLTEDFKDCGLLLSGSTDAPLPGPVIEYIGRSSFPVIQSPLSSAETMSKIANYTAKMNPDDPVTVNALIQQIEPHIFIDSMLRESAERVLTS